MFGSLVSAIVRGALLSRGKPHLGAASYLLGGVPRVRPWMAGAAVAAAGVAYGLWERQQREEAERRATQGASGAAPPLPPTVTVASGATSVPPPLPDDVVDVSSADVPLLPAHAAPANALLPLRVAVAAATCDGSVTPGEMGRLGDEARRVGAEAFVLQELRAPTPLPALVAGVTDPAVKADLYALALAICRGDAQVTEIERAFLSRLATALGLTPDDVTRLEREVAEGICSAAPPA